MVVKTETEKFTELSEKFTELEKRINEMGKVKPVKDKKPRKQSEYNIFMKEYIETEKKKDSTKTHQELFTDGAKAWTLKKEKV